MEAGLALIMEIGRQPALSRTAPTPSSSRRRSDKRPAGYIRRHAQTLYHPVGTCAMGAGDDAVVDPELRVRGVDGLRVVDASVMPTVPRGNTNAPTIAVAERAADLIRGVVPPPEAQAPLKPQWRPARPNGGTHRPGVQRPRLQEPENVRTTIEVIVEAEIERPPPVVWSFITDAERLPEWFDEFEAAHDESEPRPASAPPAHTVAPGHRSGTFETVEWDPPRRVAGHGPPWLGRWRGTAAWVTRARPGWRGPTRSSAATGLSPPAPRSCSGRTSNAGRAGQRRASAQRLKTLLEAEASTHDA